MDSASRSNRFIPSVFICGAFLFAFLVFYGITRPVLDDYDMGWHLAAGDWMLAHRTLPDHDPWSFTAGDTPWRNLSWLWDVSIAWIAAHCGLNALYMLTVTMIALLIAIVAYHLTLRRVADTQSITVILILLGLALWPAAYPRPQLFTYLMTAVFHLLLFRRRYAALPLLMLLWVNIHGGFLAGFTLIGAYGLNSLIDRRWHDFRKQLITGVLCAVTLLFTPYGISIFELVWQTMQGSEITQYISEWLPFTFKTHLGFSLLVLLMIFTSNIRNPEISLADLLLTGAWLIMALLSVRHFPIFAVIAAPYLAACLHDVLSRRPALDRPMDLYSKPTLLLSLLIPLVLMFPPVSGHLLSRTELPEDKIPLKAFEALETSGKTRVLNDYNLGGYMIYSARDRLEPFVDGRAMSAYPERVLKDYLHFVKADTNWEKNLASYDIQAVLVGDKHIFQVMYDHGAYREQWKEIYRDKLAAAYIRR